MKNHPNPKILYIGGEGRSGSTILDMLLGQINEFQSAGEIKNIWRRGFLEEDPCSCGKQISQCEFWHEVIWEAFGEFNRNDARRILNLQTDLHRKIYIPKYRLRTGTKHFKSKLASYKDILKTLYLAIAKISGHNINVDSSTQVPYAYILAGINEFDLQLIHLVRDSRAVANSWSKTTLRNPGIHEDKFLPKFSAMNSSQKWVVNNILFGILNKHRYLLLKYEYFASHPRKTLSEITMMFDIQHPEIDFIDGHYATIANTHVIAGNPVRFRQGKIKIFPHTNWKKNMALGDRLLVTSLTWPLLRKYGYM